MRRFIPAFILGALMVLSGSSVVASALTSGVPGSTPLRLVAVTASMIGPDWTLSSSSKYVSLRKIPVGNGTRCASSYPGLGHVEHREFVFTKRDHRTVAVVAQYRFTRGRVGDLVEQIFQSLTCAMEAQRPTLAKYCAVSAQSCVRQELLSGRPLRLTDEVAAVREVIYAGQRAPRTSEAYFFASARAVVIVDVVSETSRLNVAALIKRILATQLAK